MSVLLVDDHLLFAESLKILLQSEREVTIASDGKSALSLVNFRRDFSLLMLDINLPDINGNELLALLKRVEHCPPVLIISGSDEHIDAALSRQLGASGFLHKSSRPPVLMKAIEMVAEGGQWWPPSASAGNHEVADDSAEMVARHLGITQRQHQVLRLLELGYSNKAIADDLNIAETTVKSHVKALFDALGVRNRNGSLHAARNLGLLK